MNKMFVDFHTHLDCYKTEELFPQLAKFNGIIVTASMDVHSYKKNLSIREWARSHGGRVEVVPTFGVHPAKVKEVLSKSSDLRCFDEFCNASPLIGEIGMDLCWYKDATVEQQETVFRYFLQHCNQHEKFCVIHTKDAEKQISEILKDYPKVKPIIHWYDGPEDIYREFISRGYYFTFGCETCRSKHIQDLLKITPREKLLAETDNPESEPWLGGNDNSVNLIERVYADIAMATAVPVNEMQNILNNNAKKILAKTF